MVDQGTTLAIRPPNMHRMGSPLKIIGLLGLTAAIAYLFRPHLIKNKEESFADRIRRQFSSAAPHLKSLKLSIDEGVVTVSGPILVDEVDRVISFLKELPGVTGVVDRLQAHQVVKPFSH